MYPAAMMHSVPLTAPPASAMARPSPLGPGRSATADAASAFGVGGGVGSRALSAAEEEAAIAHRTRARQRAAAAAAAAAQAANAAALMAPPAPPAGSGIGGIAGVRRGRGGGSGTSPMGGRGPTSPPQHSYHLRQRASGSGAPVPPMDPLNGGGCENVDSNAAHGPSVPPFDPGHQDYLGIAARPPDARVTRRAAAAMAAMAQHQEQVEQQQQRQMQEQQNQQQQQQQYYNGFAPGYTFPPSTGSSGDLDSMVVSVPGTPQSQRHLFSPTPTTDAQIQQQQPHSPSPSIGGNGGTASSLGYGYASPMSMSMSESGGAPADASPGQLQPQPRRASLYKTEICRSWEETGICRYGNKCQFAHSMDELRTISRHPKYKTEVCRTFHEQGWCPYGRRCCFIHNEPQYKAALPPRTLVGSTQAMVSANGISAPSSPGFASTTPGSLTPRGLSMYASSSMASSPCYPASSTNGTTTPNPPGGQSPYTAATPEYTFPSYPGYLHSVPGAALTAGGVPLTPVSPFGLEKDNHNHHYQHSAHPDSPDMGAGLDSDLKHELGLDDDDMAVDPTPIRGHGMAFAAAAAAGGGQFMAATPAPPTYGVVPPPPTPPQSNNGSHSGAGGWWPAFAAAPPISRTVSGGGGGGMVSGRSGWNVYGDGWGDSAATGASMRGGGGPSDSMFAMPAAIGAAPLFAAVAAPGSPTPTGYRESAIRADVTHRHHFHNGDKGFPFDAHRTGSGINGHAMAGGPVTFEYPMTAVIARQQQSSL